MHARLLSSLAALILFGTVFAQANFNPPDPPSEFLDRSRRLEGDRIRICVAEDSLLAPLSREVAHALGSALLLDVTVVDVPTLTGRPILDHRVAYSQTELFTVLTNDCEAFAGFTLSTSGMADWLTITRPYLNTGWAFATTDPDIRSLGDLPAGARVGTRIGANVDIRFVDMNLGRTEAQRWRRVPYPNNQLLLDRLREGELDAILLWEPALMVGLDGDPAAAGVYVGAMSPLTADDQSFGLILFQRDAFLRTALDDAIALIAEDGTLRAIFDAVGVPGSVPR